MQYPVAHKFGHAIGNSRGAYPSPIMGGSSISVITHGDEYRVSTTQKNHIRINQQRREFIEDLNIIMNVGNSLRKRHLDYIMQELNSMYPSFFGYYFEIDEVIGV